eukprot:4265092-Pyramimonas_sp.AAC.1
MHRQAAVRCTGPPWPTAPQHRKCRGVGPMRAAARMNAWWDGPWSRGPKTACPAWARERLPSAGRMWSGTITSRRG